MFWRGSLGICVGFVYSEEEDMGGGATYRRQWYTSSKASDHSYQFDSDSAAYIGVDARRTEILQLPPISIPSMCIAVLLAVAAEAVDVAIDMVIPCISMILG